MNASDVYALHHVNILDQCILDQFIHIKLTLDWFELFVCNFLGIF